MRSSKIIIKDLLSWQKRFDTMDFYCNTLCSSAQICAADLTMVPIIFLDYHLRRLFRENMCTADPAEYEAMFVGEDREKPFKGTGGDQIRYIFLLRTWAKLANSKSGSDEDEMQLLNAFQHLLSSSEACLLTSTLISGCPPLDTESIRDEVLGFFDGEDKRNRDVASHIFTNLFYQEKRTPLEQQYLKDPILPPENYAVFNMPQSQILTTIGVKLLALNDLERRLKAAPTSILRLKTCAPRLASVGSMMVKSYIQKKGKFKESVEFRYGALTANLEIGPGKPTKSLDLLLDADYH